MCSKQTNCFNVDFNIDFNLISVWFDLNGTTIVLTYDNTSVCVNM